MTPPPLGDLFPTHIRDNFSERHIVPGSILRTFVTDTTPPKIKMFVVLAVDGNNISIATVYINSEVNPNIFRTPEMTGLHVPISTVDYPFLGHDSHIDCTDLREKELCVIREALSADIGVLMGNLNAADFDTVRTNIRRADTIPIKKKRKYGLI